MTPHNSAPGLSGTKDRSDHTVDNNTHAAAKAEQDISKEQAISIAKQDALRADLSPESYAPFAVEEGEVWHVIFEPKDQKDNLEPEYKIYANGPLVGNIYEGFSVAPS